MPRKVRQLEAELRKAGFVLDTSRGKGSHGWWVHPTGAVADVSGHAGDDAHYYQEKEVREAIAEATRRMAEQEVQP